MNHAKECHANSLTERLNDPSSLSENAVKNATCSSLNPASVAMVKSAACRGSLTGPAVATTSTKTSKGSGGPRSTRMSSGRFLSGSMVRPIELSNAT